MRTKNANLPNGYLTWQEALDYVKGMNNGTYENFGYTDWRLPNRKELHSLADYLKYNPALPTGHSFTNVQANNYWSSTSNANNTDNA
jgi:formylglycine-generating enzyme required for sulfatase activity